MAPGLSYPGTTRPSEPPGLHLSLVVAGTTCCALGSSSKSYTLQDGWSLTKGKV